MSTASVFASGPRLDYPSDGDGTQEENDCWVNGYDSGFAGKYDSDRAKECLEEGGDQYNKSWDIGCRDGGFNESQCADFINNPVEIEDYGALKGENDRTCYDAGREDGEAGRPFNKERDDGCYEFDDISNGYEGGYQGGCETHSTPSTVNYYMKTRGIIVLTIQIM